MKGDRILLFLVAAALSFSCQQGKGEREVVKASTTPVQKTKDELSKVNKSVETPLSYPRFPPDKEIQARLVEMAKRRAVLMKDFRDLSPKAGLDPSRQAVSAFSKRGFEFDKTVVHIRRPGCVVEVSHGGRRFREAVEGYGSCRLAEIGSRGEAQIWEVPGTWRRGVVIIDITENQEDPRCSTLINTLRWTAQGPRLSRSTSPISLCGYHGVDDIFYELLSLEDHLMHELPRPDQQ